MDENEVVAQAIAVLGSSAAEAFHATEGFPPTSRIGQYLIALKISQKLHSLDLIGWCSLGPRTGLLESDLQFHNRHFRRLSDVGLLIRPENGTSWLVELYTRAFSGSLSAANHVSQRGLFSPSAAQFRGFDIALDARKTRRELRSHPRWISSSKVSLVVAGSVFAALLTVSGLVTLSSHRRQITTIAAPSKTAHPQGASTSKQQAPLKQAPASFRSEPASHIPISKIFLPEEPRVIPAERRNDRKASVRKPAEGLPAAELSQASTAQNRHQESPAGHSYLENASTARAAAADQEARPSPGYDLHRSTLSPSSQPLGQVPGVAHPTAVNSAVHHAVTQTVSVAARPLRQVIPHATGPAMALFSDVQIPVDVTVSPTGKVVGVVARPAPGTNQAIIGAALKAAQQWTFQPATFGNQNVSSKYTILFRFHASQ